MKINTYLIAFTLVLIGHSSSSQSLLLDKVVAKVGSEFISFSDVEEEYQYSLSVEPTLTEDAKCGILESAIAQKVIIYQAILDSVEVTDEEVETQLDLRFESVLRQMNGDEQLFKQYYGASVPDMKERYRDDQKQKILAERMQYKLIDEVSITPAEVKEFFHAIPTDSLPLLNSEVEISELVLKPEVNEVERLKALEKMESIQSRLLAGEDFAELAKEFSDDTESAKRGGDLGYAKRGTYVTEFEGAVFGLKPGETSDIIETEFGFHIIQTIERRGNSVKARHILVKPQITFGDEVIAKNKLDSVRQLIILDSMSFEEAVKKFSLKDMPSYSNNGKLKNPATGNNFFETKDLDHETYFAIEALKVGELSKVAEVKDFRGEKMYRLLKLQYKSKPHRINLQEDYDKIQYFAKESKKSTYFADWLDDKMNKTFIQVDSIYKDCPNVEKWVVDSSSLKP